jgi:hypothetical protein
VWLWVLEADQSEEEHERDGRAHRRSGIAAAQIASPILSGLAPDPGVAIESWCQLWFIQRSFELSIYALAIAGRSLLPARC